jgi:phage-related holin
VIVLWLIVAMLVGAILARTEAFKEINSRDGKWSSKKIWFNVCCLTATIVLAWIAYKDTMEDYAFIIFYCIYLVCLGGFEIIPKVLGMVLEFKTGKKVEEVSNATS